MVRSPSRKMRGCRRQLFFGPRYDGARSLNQLLWGLTSYTYRYGISTVVLLQLYRRSETSAAYWSSAHVQRYSLRAADGEIRQAGPHRVDGLMYSYSSVAVRGLYRVVLVLYCSRLGSYRSVPRGYITTLPLPPSVSPLTDISHSLTIVSQTAHDRFY